MASKRAFSGADDVLAESPTSNKRPRTETNASARRQLFVRSLPATATTSALTELFSENYPLKHATVVLDPETQQSKGYGFVTFADAEDAQRALDEFNGQSFQGRKMKIEIAEPRSRDSAPRKGGMNKEKSAVSVEIAATKKARQDKMAETKQLPKLIIRNLPWSIKTPEQLAEIFRLCGKVKHSTLPKKGEDTQAGFGFVVMRGRKNAERAIAEINGKEIDGRTIAVDWAVDKETWEGQKTPSEKHDTEADASDSEEQKDVTDSGAVIRRMPSIDPEDADQDLENFFKNFGDALESEDEEAGEEVDFEDSDDVLSAGNSEAEDDDDENGDDDTEKDSNLDEEEQDLYDRPVREKVMITDNSSTLFIRNLPFTTTDESLKEQFMPFGPVRYARVVMDRATERPKGTGFVCFFNVEDADKCFREAPRQQITGANATKLDAASKNKHSILQDENADNSGLYTIDGRVLQVSKAVEKEKAIKLTEEGNSFRTGRDQDRRRLYLLSEGTVSAGTSLYAALAPSEIKMREDSATQRKKLIQNNPTLHLSLTRLSIRNLPRNIDSKALKALAREAVVGFASDVKANKRPQLSKEEEARGGDEMREAEKNRKAKGKGIVRQSKIVFEGREGAKVTEDSGAGRSRGYGFIEYSSHRWALMGLRWLNGHAVESGSGKKQRLIVEFAIENAQVVQRRKEKEEKARIRSSEVMKAREEAEKSGKKIVKKALTKDQQMAKTRKGMKERGHKGKNMGPPGSKPFQKPPPLGERKKFQKGPGVGEKRKRDGSQSSGPRNKFVKTEDKKFKPGYAPGEEGRLQRRADIAATKKHMKKTRGKGRG